MASGSEVARQAARHTEYMVGEMHEDMRRELWKMIQNSAHLPEGVRALHKSLSAKHALAAGLRELFDVAHAAIKGTP